MFVLQAAAFVADFVGPSRRPCPRGRPDAGHGRAAVTAPRDGSRRDCSSSGTLSALPKEPSMSRLSDFPIAQRWPAQHPDRLQLYSLATPNGVKVSIMLEETGLPYEVHRIDIMANENQLPEFLALNPNGKIPAIIDPDGPGGEPLGLFESGAILMYLADKTGKFIPVDPASRWETIQWVFFQMAAIGPMFGQVGFFHKFAGREYEDKRPLERYVAESQRLLGVLDARLDDRTWLMGDEYTIADIATVGWVRNLIGFYEARELVQFHRYPHVAAWLDRVLARPAVQRGLAIPASA
jgi:GST-like protein